MGKVGEKKVCFGMKGQSHKLHYRMKNTMQALLHHEVFARIYGLYRFTQHI